MIINDLENKAFNRLKLDLGKQKDLFKTVNHVPSGLFKTYTDLYTNTVWDSPDIVRLKLSQPQHSDFGYILSRHMYGLASLCEAKSGYPANGGENSLTVLDTKENLVDWLEIVRDTIDSDNGNIFVDECLKSLENIKVNGFNKKCTTLKTL